MPHPLHEAVGWWLDPCESQGSNLQAKPRAQDASGESGAHHQEHSSTVWERRQQSPQQGVHKSPHSPVLILTCGHLLHWPRSYMLDMLSELRSFKKCPLAEIPTGALLELTETSSQDRKPSPLSALPPSPALPLDLDLNSDLDFNGICSCHKNIHSI